MQFYAKAKNASGQIEQMLVTKKPGKPIVPQWTGKIYTDDHAADADLIALNCEIARKTRSFERMANQAS